MRLDDVASATEFLFRSSNRCPVVEQLWKTVAKRYAATSRFFWGVTLSGMMRLGPLPPRSSALYQAPSPSPSPSGRVAIEQQLSVCGIMSQRSVKQLTHLFRLAPLKSSRATSIWRARRGPMAPKPKPARFEFTVAMVLAMALTILAVMTWADRDLAALSSSATYHPQLLLL